VCFSRVFFARFGPNLGVNIYAIDASSPPQPRRRRRGGVERRLPRVSRRSPHLELDALLAHEEVDVARRRSRRRPVAARRGAGRWGARRRHRRRRGDAAEAPRRLADPVLDALEVRAQARLCCVCFLRYGDRRPLGVAIFPLVGVGSAGGARRTAAPTRQRSPNERLSRQPWT